MHYHVDWVRVAGLAESVRLIANLSEWPSQHLFSGGEKNVSLHLLIFYVSDPSFWPLSLSFKHPTSSCTAFSFHLFSLLPSSSHTDTSYIRSALMDSSLFGLSLLVKTGKIYSPLSFASPRSYTAFFFHPFFFLPCSNFVHLSSRSARGCAKAITVKQLRMSFIFFANWISSCLSKYNEWIRNIIFVCLHIVQANPNMWVLKGLSDILHLICVVFFF